MANDGSDMTASIAWAAGQILVERVGFDSAAFRASVFAFCGTEVSTADFALQVCPPCHEERPLSQRCLRFSGGTTTMPRPTGCCHREPTPAIWRTTMASAKTVWSTFSRARTTQAAKETIAKALMAQMPVLSDKAERE